MSRFGSTMEIYWNEGNAAGTFVADYSMSIDQGDMPQFPVEERRVTDEVEYRSKSGRKYQYRNYSKVGYTFNWTNLRATVRDALATMVYSLPCMAIKSGDTTFGTFQLAPDSVTDQETSFQLYDFSFDVEEM